jgi:hypothetical protein
MQKFSFNTKIILKVYSPHSKMIVSFYTSPHSLPHRTWNFYRKREMELNFDMTHNAKEKWMLMSSVASRKSGEFLRARVCVRCAEIDCRALWFDWAIMVYSSHRDVRERYRMKWWWHSVVAGRERMMATFFRTRVFKNKFNNSRLIYALIESSS